MSDPLSPSGRDRVFYLLGRKLEFVMTKIHVLNYDLELVEAGRTTVVKKTIFMGGKSLGHRGNQNQK